MKRLMSGGNAGLACAVLLMSQLTACGGGDGSSASSPPPPSSSPPPPATVSLTLAGTVTDEPIANATVTATVAGETFTTTADAEGNYSLVIEIEEADTGSFVTLHAQGTGDQAFVEFTSLAGSFESLATAAGDDDIVSSSENFSTQITNVSTATAVLVQAANGGAEITSDETLATLGAQVNAQEVLDLATAIKLAVDQSEDYPLPAGTTILDIARDAESRQDFVDSAYATDPDNFAEAQQDIAADPAMARDIDEARLIEMEALTTATLSTDAGFTFNNSRRVVHFDLREDHTGGMSTDTNDVPMTWTVQDKKLVVSFNSPVENVSYDTENCEAGGGVRQVEAHYVSNGAVVTFITESQITITTTSEVTYADCASLAPRTVTETEARTVLSLDHFDVIDDAELVGAVQTLYVWDEAQQTVVADIADLGDGTGVTRLTNQAFTWEMQDDGKIVHVEFANGAIGEYLSFGDIDEVVSDLFWEVRAPDDGPVYMGAGASVYGEPEGSMTVTGETVVGRFYQFGIGNESTPDPRLKGFRLRFDADFMGAQEDDYIDDEGNLVTRDETLQSFNGFRWNLDGNSIVLRRTWDTQLQQETCLYTAENCIVYDIRRIVPLAMEGSRVYVLEERRAAPGAVVDESTPTTRLVRYYDYEAPAEAAQSKLRAMKVEGFKSRALVKGAKPR